MDNALAAITHAVEFESGNLSDMNQLFSDALCGATDDPEMGTCEGNGDACTDGEDCPGRRCRLDDGDCKTNIPAADIRFVVDAAVVAQTVEINASTRSRAQTLRSHENAAVLAQKFRLSTCASSSIEHTFGALREVHA